MRREKGRVALKTRFFFFAKSGSKIDCWSPTFLDGPRRRGGRRSEDLGKYATEVLARSAFARSLAALATSALATEESGATFEEGFEGRSVLRAGGRSVNWSWWTKQVCDACVHHHPSPSITIHAPPTTIHQIHPHIHHRRTEYTLTAATPDAPPHTHRVFAGARVHSNTSIAARNARIALTRSALRRAQEP